MNKYIRQFLLLTGVGLLAFSLACGGSGGSGRGSGGGGGTGSFTNASLSGQYAYQIKGYSLPSQTPFVESGVFTADGNGHITNGKDDFAVSTTVSPDTTTGTYQIGGDGSGVLTLNFGSGGSAAFELVLSSSSQFYLIETDSAINSGLVASGSGQKQDTSAFTSAPSGTYILRMHTITNSGGTATPKSTVGAFTVTGGAVSGNMDNQQFASFTSTTVTGAFNAPDTTGRGTGSFVDSSSGTLSFVYYVVDASHLVFFSTNVGTIGIGVAEKQSGTTFTAASFSGPYAFGSSGDTGSFFEQTTTVGRFNADGISAISAGALDNATDGITTTNLSFTGTYTVAGSGRVAVTLTPTGGGSAVQQVYWMVSPTRAFFVTDSANSVEDGSLDTQVGTFSNSSLSGNYAFEMDGFDGGLANTKQRVGIINANGSGTLSLGEVSNALGAVSSTSSNLTGSYAVSSNGRVTGSVNTLSNNLVFYLVSGSNAYMLQNDTGVAIKGTMIKQP